MAATKKSEALESAGIKKPSQEQQRNPDSERASQEKREALGTKKPKDSFHDTGLDHPQHSYSKYERSHTSAKTEREE
jgi:hypothetical protein